MRHSLDVLKEGFDARNARYGGARLRFFEGGTASARGAFPSGQVLSTITCPTPLFNPCSASASGRTVTVTATKVSGALQDVSADNDGILGSFVFDDNGAFLGDGTVGLAGSGADCIVDRVEVAKGGAFVVQTLVETDAVTE